MNKVDVIIAIRGEALDLPTDKFSVVLNQFQLESYSVKCLNDMSLSRLQKMLGKIRRLIILDCAPEKKGNCNMRKVHYKVVLDVYVHEDDDANMADRLMESGFVIDYYQDEIREVGDIQEITIEEVTVTDSR